MIQRCAKPPTSPRGSEGGVLDIQNGGTVSGEIDFEGDAIPMLARATTAVIGVFMQNDTIDLQHVAYNAGDKVQLLAGNVLEVDNAGGAALADISLPTTMGYSADQFVLSPSDGLDIAVNTVTVVAAAAANASIHLDALNADFATHRDRIDRSRRVASVTVTDNSPVSTTIVQFGGDAARLRRND
jgi:hypothetical protein